MNPNRKKVLFIIESLAGGGAEKVLSTLVAHIDRAVFDVTVMTVVDAGKYVGQVSAVATYRSILGPAPRSLLKRVGYWLRYKLVYCLPARWIYQAYIKERYDVEVAFVEGFATKLIASSTNPTSCKIAWVHIDLSANHWTQSIFRTTEKEALAYRSFQHIACVSQQVKTSVVSLFGVSDKAMVIYNTVDSDEILRMAEEPLPEKRSGTRLQLISTGRLAPQKGYDRLLRIHKQLLDEGLDHDLTLLGEGPDRSELEAYIREHKLEETVHLPGFQSNPYAIMHKADLFVCSSRSEGYSTAVTEALIVGLPVITTECSGMKELLGDANEFGIVVENAEEALLMGLRELLGDPDKIQHYKKRAEERGSSFSLRNTIPPIEKLLSAPQELSGQSSQVD